MWIVYKSLHCIAFIYVWHNVPPESELGFVQTVWIRKQNFNSSSFVKQKKILIRSYQGLQVVPTICYIFEYIFYTLKLVFESVSTLCNVLYSKIGLSFLNWRPLVVCEIITELNVQIVIVISMFFCLFYSTFVT